MNVGLVVEGATDLATYPVFIRRIRNDLGELQIRECGGSRLKNLFPKFLSEFDRNSAWRIDLALVIRDSDCKAPQESEAKLREILRHCNFRRRFRVEVFATPCMLESWLLSDVGAVAQVAANRGRNPGTGLPEISIELRNSQSDKAVFLRVLARLGLPATPPVYAEIAQVAGLTVIENRCGYFREFRNRIIRA